MKKIFALLCAAALAVSLAACAKKDPAPGIMEIAVVGSGGWGTALAKMLTGNGHQVTLWSFLKEEAETLERTRENPLLRGVRLPDMTFTSDPACVAGKKVVVMASPSFAARSTSELVKPYLEEDAVLVSVAKGIEAGTSKRLSEIIGEVTGRENVFCAVKMFFTRIARQFM